MKFTKKELELIHDVLAQEAEELRDLDSLDAGPQRTLKLIDALLYRIEKHLENT